MTFLSPLNPDSAVGAVSSAAAALQVCWLLLCGRFGFRPVISVFRWEGRLFGPVEAFADGCLTDLVLLENTGGVGVAQPFFHPITPSLCSYQQKVSLALPVLPFWSLNPSVYVCLGQKAAALPLDSSHAQHEQAVHWETEPCPSLGLS